MSKALLVNDIVTLTAAALGLLVNCATLIALLLNRRHLTTKAYLVLSLTLGGIVTVAGSVLQTIYIVQAVSGIDCLSKAQVLMRDVKYIGLILTLLGLNALCIDLYVAVMHSIRYRVVCSKKRVRMLICVKWLVGIILGCASSISHLIVGAQKRTRCDNAAINIQGQVFNIRGMNNETRTAERKVIRTSSDLLAHQLPALPSAIPRQPPPPLKSVDFLMNRFYISECILVAVLAASVLFITVSLARIYRKLKRRVRRNGRLACGEHSSACGTSSGGSGGIRRHCSISNTRAKRRGASTILVMFVGFNATVLPYIVGEFYSIIVTNREQSRSSSNTQDDLQFILYSLPYLYALAASFTVLNPVVMSLRMREVQAGYVIMCQRLCHHNSQQHHQHNNRRHNLQLSVTDGICESLADNNDSILPHRSIQERQQKRSQSRRDCKDQQHLGRNSSSNSYGMVSFSVAGNDATSCSAHEVCDTEA